MNIIHEINIKNFKSVKDVKLKLGRVNVFIGENGAGKSNILEAIAFCAAASAEKLDNEFLASRGIRVTDPELMRSAFDDQGLKEPIEIGVSLSSPEGEQLKLDYSIQNDNEPYAKWQANAERAGKIAFEINDLISKIKEASEDPITASSKKNQDELSGLIDTILDHLKKKLDTIKEGGDASDLDQLSMEAKGGRIAFIDKKIESLTSKFSEFVIFSPENSMLRALEKEGQILPLGINGEGLQRFLQVISKQPDSKAYRYIQEALSLFSWYDGVKIEQGGVENCILARDKHLRANNGWIDQRSTNEGFLFTAFYFSLFSSPLTPSFFAIDNIDASLNPKLCVEMMKRIAVMSKENDKQCILTTHNPAILDGLDTTDEDQKLFIISRNRIGETVVRQFDKKPDLTRKKMSELFMSGALGGLPKGF